MQIHGTKLKNAQICSLEILLVYCIETVIDNAENRQYKVLNYAFFSHRKLSSIYFHTHPSPIGLSNGGLYCLVSTS